MRRSRDADYVPRGAYARHKTLGAVGEGHEYVTLRIRLITTEFNRGLRETQKRRKRCDLFY